MNTAVRVPSGGAELVGDLVRPPGPPPYPAVVLAPGFGALRAAALPAYAERFAEAGFLALRFDYRHFGESGGEPRQLVSVRRQIEDLHAALAFLRRLPDVDVSRVALWGTSFSGGHVVRVAAEDGDVAAVVSQVPFTSGWSSAWSIPLLSSLKLIAAAVADRVRSGIGGAPVEVKLVGRPGTAAIMALDDAVEGFRTLHEGLPWENRVCARIGPATLVYRPIRYASRVRCPLLVQVGERDVLTPPGPARRMAGRAPRGEHLSYPIGHFEVYQGDVFESVIGAQIEFLLRHLGVDRQLPPQRSTA